MNWSPGALTGNDGLESHMASYEFVMSDGPAVLSGNNLVVFGLGVAMRPRLPVQDLPNMGRGFASGMAGTTEVPGVWVADARSARPITPEYVSADHRVCMSGRAEDYAALR